MDTKDKANAECQINKSDDNITKVSHSSKILYFRPETEEVIIIPSEDAGDFDSHCLEMLGCVDAFHHAKRVYLAEIEKFGHQRKTSDGIPEPQAKAVVAAEDEMEQKRKDLLEKLKGGETSNMGYQDVVELLPLHDTRRRGPGNQQLGRRYAYASQRYFSERSGGRSEAGTDKKWHTVSLRNRDTATGNESIYTVNRHGRRTIDTQKLKKQLTQNMLPVLKVELKDYIDLDDYNLDETLFEWADSWNESLNGTHTYENGIELSGAAQFMRFISNVGAEAEFDPNQGSVRVRGEIKGSVAIASGVANAGYYIPDRLGWDLSYVPGEKSEKNDGVTPPSFNMGVVRIYIEGQLVGFVGASAQLEAQLQVMVKDDEQQIVAGQPQGRLPRFRERQGSSSGQFYRQMKKEDEGLSASAEAFVGARAEASLKGAIQWLKPTPPPAQGSTAITKTVGDFTDLATIGGSIAGLAGIGGGANFYCTFINGKFCFKVAASLCCGLGAKGAFICEVGGKALLEFGRWLAYQLFTLDYHFFELMAKETFRTFTRICVMNISDLKNDVYQMYNDIKSSMDSVKTEFDDRIAVLIDESEKNIDSSKRRNQLAKNVIAAPGVLLNYTPEAKGILLYLLTRHGKWDHIDLDNRGSMFLDIYSERKEAIIQVLHSIQTRREWIKVMCHRSEDGSDLAVERPELQVMAEQEQQLRDFLQEGINRDRDMDLKAAELSLKEIYDRLKSDRELSWGYALAMNNTPWYNLNRSPNPHFPQRCESGPYESATTQNV